MFKLKRPCGNCPFRRGQGELFRLDLERLEEIRKATAFQCHKTVNYSDDGQPRSGEKPQQCVGLMAVLHRQGEPNQIMQVAERLSALKPGELDTGNEAYSSWAEVIKAHVGKSIK